MTGRRIGGWRARCGARRPLRYDLRRVVLPLLLALAHARPPPFGATHTDTQPFPIHTPTASSKLPFDCAITLLRRSWWRQRLQSTKQPQRSQSPPHWSRRARCLCLCLSALTRALNSLYTHSLAPAAAAAAAARLIGVLVQPLAVRRRRLRTLAARARGGLGAAVELEIVPEVLLVVVPEPLRLALVALLLGAAQQLCRFAFILEARGGVGVSEWRRVSGVRW